MLTFYILAAYSKYDYFATIIEISTFKSVDTYLDTKLLNCTDQFEGFLTVGGGFLFKKQRLFNSCTFDLSYDAFFHVNSPA